MYKHLLGWPVMLTDLEHLDAEIFNNLCRMREIDDIEGILCLDFTVTEDNLGTVNMVQLKPNGENIAVTNANYVEYMELRMKYHLLRSIKEQVKALLVGFYDVVPEPLLSVFGESRIFLFASFSSHARPSPVCCGVAIRVRPYSE